MSLLTLLYLPLLYLRAAAFALNTVIVAILHTLILLPIYPAKFIFPQLYVTIESFLYSKCGEAFIPVWIVSPKLRIYTDTLSDIEPISRRRAMIMANHQDSGDVPVMMGVLAFFNISHTATWILDRMFYWTPFGVPSQWHGDCFSQEGSKSAVIKHIKKHFSTTYYNKGHKWLIFFPEGGYLKNRGILASERSRKYVEDNNLPKLYNCSLPRTTAFINVAQVFRGEAGPVPELVEDIVDVTIAYKGPRDLGLGDIGMGTFHDKEVYLNFRTYKMSDLPTDEEDLKNWLYDRYQEKEVLLSRFKEKGVFEEGSTFTQLHQCPGRLFGSVCFWYISAFFIYDFYKTLFGYLMRLSSAVI